jgi:hypothetical protein
MRGGRGVSGKYHGVHFPASQKVHSSGLTPTLTPTLRTPTHTAFSGVFGFCDFCVSLRQSER